MNSMVDNKHIEQNNKPKEPKEQTKEQTKRTNKPKEQTQSSARRLVDVWQTTDKKNNTRRL